MGNKPGLETTLGNYLIESIKSFKPGDDIKSFKQHLNLIVCKYPNVLNSSDDENGCTPLMYVAYSNHAGLVPALINAGATVNATNKNGDTALMIAITSGYCYYEKNEIVQALINAGGKTAEQLIQDIDGNKPIED